MHAILLNFFGPRHVLERFCGGNGCTSGFIDKLNPFAYKERYFICCLAEVPAINKWQGYKCVCFYNVLHYFPLKEGFFPYRAQREEFGCCFECLWTFNEATMGLTGAIIGNIT